jgi:hypothetical protein
VSSRRSLKRLHYLHSAEWGKGREIRVDDGAARARAQAQPCLMCARRERRERATGGGESFSLLAAPHRRVLSQSIRILPFSVHGTSLHIINLPSLFHTSPPSSHAGVSDTRAATLSYCSRLLARVSAPSNCPLQVAHSLRTLVRRLSTRNPPGHVQWHSCRTSPSLHGWLQQISNALPTANTPPTDNLHLPPTLYAD